MERDKNKDSIIINDIDEKDEELIEDDLHYNQLLEMINIEREKHHLNEVTEFDIDVLEYSNAIVLNTVNDLDSLISEINKIRNLIGKKEISSSDYEHLSKRFDFDTWNQYLDIIKKLLHK